MRITIENTLASPIHVTVFLLTGKGQPPTLSLVGGPEPTQALTFPAYAYVITASHMLADIAGEPALRKQPVGPDETIEHEWDEERAVLVALQGDIMTTADTDLTEETEAAPARIVVRPIGHGQGVAT